ncbi:response regulator receiver modulated CheB methylesterase [Paenibacillus curdlanolyticus YK9]|uniref:Protein-glutamate methylesterase/protein-glutamine glutaminase n=1 Tax=Paenibacillus curdlanolyticus YK9 TaxID=717606 RepID=E0I463_9BACL|nr:chemotaxis response regulator protein-glutamate methylesterase [Paenibacillus curdlanolyticus]EFM13077.1 response regulator receiver modulated CheB methylesterase [Paenibacillus curdlanolyticus YK9]
MAPYRVLVVDDSAFMRTIISDLVSHDKQFEIVATASNGLEAIDAIGHFKPDAVTMDLEMPVMNGLEALKRIMKDCPLPVIMLSGISEENTRDTIKALHTGAFDFIRKPAIDGSVDIEQVGEQLRDKLRIAVLIGRIRYRTETKESLSGIGSQAERKRPGGSQGQAVDRNAPISSASIPNTKRSSKGSQSILGLEKSKEKDDQQAATDRQPESKLTAKSSKAVSNLKKRPDTEPVHLVSHEDEDVPRSQSKPKGSTTFDNLVVVGTSTGGPRALHEVICSLPDQFEAPVLVVQHMPAKFTKSLAQRLDAYSAVRVTEAVQGERIETGTVYIAPGGYHLEIARDRAGYYVNLTEAEPRNGHRPSVDVLFESAAQRSELRKHAVIMTGMGSDGAKGMKLLREQGAATTIAEAEETCVVYGMPRTAVEIGAAMDVLPLPRISGRIVEAVAKRR